MKIYLPILFLAIVATAVTVDSKNGEKLEPLNTTGFMASHSPGEEFSGGATTVADTGLNSYGRPSMNLVGGGGSERWLTFREGKGIFDRNWSKGKFSGLLGPRFTANSCKGCHFKDGRGHPPLHPGESPTSMVMQLSIAGNNGSTYPHPVYGTQLNFHGTGEAPAEGSFEISYREISGEFADGESYTLVAPEYHFRNLAYGEISGNNAVMISPRVAPANFGLGLIEAIPEQDILKHADPNDANNDGISGRPNYITEHISGKRMIGRFGWKANQPTLEQQAASAFISDMGITSSLFPRDPHEIHQSGRQPELTRQDLDTVIMYLKLLAVPKRRSFDAPEVLMGKGIFTRIGCGECHVPSFTTGIMKDFPELDGQKIYPYTDLLLHDMGDELSDGRPDGEATGREWRTPPLWGIGLVDNVNGHSRFLHDGRARNLEEAILWHGGEAERSQQLYRRLKKKDRGALLAFLESL